MSRVDDKQGNIAYFLYYFAQNQCLEIQYLTYYGSAYYSVVEHSGSPTYNMLVLMSDWKIDKNDVEEVYRNVPALR